MPDLARNELVHVAPDPRLPGFYGAHERMLGIVEVPGCVLVLGRITATDVSAL